jgi:hypothetical protein
VRILTHKMHCMSSTLNNAGCHQLYDIILLIKFELYFLLVLIRFHVSFIKNFDVESKFVFFQTPCMWKRLFLPHFLEFWPFITLSGFITIQVDNLNVIIFCILSSFVMDLLQFRFYYNSGCNSALSFSIMFCYN